jgi:hypothetical protein
LQAKHLRGVSDNIASFKNKNYSFMADVLYVQKEIRRE